MKNADQEIYSRLEEALDKFENNFGALPGIAIGVARETLLRQFVDSVRRVKFISMIRSRPISAARTDPRSDLFDPIRAAIVYHANGNFDEACWLIFLITHFGKNLRGGWRLLRDVYGRLGEGEVWTWARTSRSVESFRKWLASKEHVLAPRDPKTRKAQPIRGFGNHRKYQSISAHSPNGTGDAISTYIAWVGPHRSHRELFERELKATGSDARAGFDALYKSLADVVSFGRMAKFDYLTMLAKVGVVRIEPGSTYMEGASGPFDGAKLLFGGTGASTFLRRDLDQKAVKLADALRIGMQEMEDALCNWQKSPESFRRFRG